MTKEEVIRIGKLMGLKHDPFYNFQDNEERGYIVFNGINGQRFAYDVPNMTDDEIFEKFGNDLQLMGRRQLKLELHNLLNITTDN